MLSPTSTRTLTARARDHRVVALALAALALLATGLVTAVSGGPARSAPAPVVRWTEPDALGGATSTTSTTSLYKVSSYVAGKPVRWNPCAPIHWRFRTTGAPTGGLSMAKSAVWRIAVATGIRFVYDGTTTATPTSKWLPSSTTSVRPVLIGWTDGAHSDLLAGRPANVLGVTRTAYFGATVDGTTLAATKAAVIALDRTNKLPMYGSLSWSATLLHELGHAMGLDHVGATSQLMYPMLHKNIYSLQYGDKAGLARLGRSAGCINLPF